MNAQAAAALVTVAILAGSGTLFSQDDRTIYGAGANSCAQWTKERAEGAAWLVPAQWLLGYVSAINRYSRTPPARIEARDMALRIDAYCEVRPDDDVSDAAEELVEYLLSGSSPDVAPTFGSPPRDDPANR